MPSPNEIRHLSEPCEIRRAPLADMYFYNLGALCELCGESRNDGMICPLFGDAQRRSRG
jgi:hypothetical protein